MNLEFMCCILYGLTEINMKPERKRLSADETRLDHTITLCIQQSNTTDKSLLNSKDLTK